MRTGVQVVTLPGVSGKVSRNHCANSRQESDFEEHSGRDLGPDYVIRRSIQLLEMAFGGDLTGATGEH